MINYWAHPDIFKRFLTARPKIDKRKYDTDIRKNLVQKQLTPDVITNVAAEFGTKLTEIHPRDDYKELWQLALVFVGSLDDNVVGYRTPGAIHHTKWMAKAIYCFKMVILRHQFKMSEEEEESHVPAVSVFLVKIYFKAWFNVSTAHLASKQYLDILHSLLDCKEYGNDTAEITLAQISEPFVVFEYIVGGITFLLIPPLQKTKSC
ncbi:hypothetical protein QYM36_017091 [Artemia franciscana]|uniref:Uncharacterized protein n=1 Tax=Artemia franciscana TaxID=6661 RepID=A0AA88KWK7_ARTSF|nr:hypothetical protein QYM36_017091 [Artemia franciscana]